MREFTERDARVRFETLNDFQRSQSMTRYYLHEVLRITNPGVVPDDEEDLEACFGDGAGDAAVDFLAVQEGRVTIIQAKYHGQDKAESEQAFSHFCDVLERLHPKTGRAYKVSARVRELAADIDWENDSFDLQFLTLGKVNQNMRAREGTGFNSVTLADLQDRVDISLLDEKGLNERLRDAATAGQFIPEPVSLSLSTDADGTPWLHTTNTAGRDCYIGYIRAGQLQQLHRFRNKLFALNIRNYTGNTKTNKGIINTALTEPGNFFFYNNGISAVATKIVPDETRAQLSCERFSIINGAQTVKALVRAHARNAAAVGNVTVLVRVTEVDMKPDREEKNFLDEITRFNNTQNVVKTADFRSNDPIQLQLVREFAALPHRGGRQYLYKNKRDADPNPRKIMINMEEFAKTIYAFQFGPVDVFGGTDHLFDLGKDGGYAKIFGDGSQVWESMSPEDFQRLAGTWFLCDHARRQADQVKQELVADAEKEEEKAAVKQALERRWMIFFVVGELLRTKYRRAGEDLDSTLRRLSKPNWLDSEKEPPSTVVDKYGAAACQVLVKLYLTASKDPTFVVRNWFRSKDTRDAIVNEVKYSTMIVEALPFLAGQDRARSGRR